MKDLLITLVSLMLIGVQSFCLCASAYGPCALSSGNHTIVDALTQIASKPDLPLTGDFISETIPETSRDRAVGHLIIDTGNFLFHPDEDIVVETNKANVSIKTGATVFIMDSGKDLMIYDLYQTKPEEISVQAGEKALDLAPGQMLVFTDENTTSFEALKANCHSIGYRNPKRIYWHNGIQGFHVEFSIFSALAKIEPLTQLATSTDVEDRVVPEEILQSAIALTKVISHPRTNSSMGR